MGHKTASKQGLKGGGSGTRPPVAMEIRFGDQELDAQDWARGYVRIILEVERLVGTVTEAA